MTRIVVVLFGPSAAGKTTIARESGLTVYDRDDEQWRQGGEKAFSRAIKSLSRDTYAQACVIRAGASSKARAATIHTVGATHAFLVDTSRDVCHARAGHRRRGDAKRSHSYIDSWFERHERDDGIAVWPGSWEQALAQPFDLPPFMPEYMRAGVRADTRSKAGDPRGTQAWKRLRARVYSEETYCWRCGQWVDQGLPRNHPLSRSADHLDQLARGGVGVPHRSRVRLSHWSCNSSRGARVDQEDRVITVDLADI